MEHKYIQDAGCDNLQFHYPAEQYLFSEMAPRNSNRQFPEILLSVEYGASDIVRMISNNGQVRYAGKEFVAYPAALHQTETDHLLTVFLCEQHAATDSISLF